ncbi:MAG: 2Fe-2S iron-sulfur cluster binding domain-containing protein [Gammaproteobacteria bacterium]|nr:2Fe-2S iron-sulfur cluster binding domain-containing protein [Gammaproteobacteria bacterium]
MPCNHFLSCCGATPGRAVGLLDKLLGKSAHTVTARPSGVSFEVRANQSILEAALAQGIAFPHSCTVGTCGSCKCRLKSGRIREITNFGYVLSAAELQGDVILACQAAPKTDLELEVAGLASKRLHPAGDFTGRITAQDALTPDIRRVTLRLDRPLHFDAGQYVQLAVPEVFGARAYSLAIPPHADGCGEIALFIRHVPGGAFTDLLFDGRLDDVELRVHGPSGNFWLRESRAPMLCVAGGSGLAPLLSLLEDAAARDVGRPCVVLFGARTQADLYAQDAIAAVGERWNGAFSFVPVLSDEPASSDWAGARGLVTAHIAASFTAFTAPDAEAYLCGPPPMIDAAEPVLRELGIAAENTHCDRFLDGSHGLARQELG